MTEIPTKLNELKEEIAVVVGALATIATALGIVVPESEQAAIVAGAMAVVGVVLSLRKRRKVE